MRALSLLIPMSLFILGCSSELNPLGADKYEMHVVDDQIYVLNTRTGFVFRIKNGLRVEVPRRTLDDILEQYRLHSVKFTSVVADIITVRGSSKLIGGAPKIRGSIKPFIPALEKQAGIVLFNLHLVDVDGFHLGTIGILPEDFTREVDGNGNYIGWLFQKDIPIEKAVFQNATSVAPTWSRLMSEVIDNWLKSEEGAAWQKNLGLSETGP